MDSGYNDFLAVVKGISGKEAIIAANSAPLQVIFSGLTDGMQYTIIVTTRTSPDADNVQQSSVQVLLTTYTCKSQIKCHSY